MTVLCSIATAILGNVVSYYIIKWLDSMMR